MLRREESQSAAARGSRTSESALSRSLLGPEKPDAGAVLIVEDEIESMLELSDWFESKSIQFLAKSDPYEALETVLQNKSIMIAVIDAYMGRMSGYDLIAAIQMQLPRERKLKFILITGHPTYDDHELATRLGIVDFLKKPLDLEALERALHGELEGS